MSNAEKQLAHKINFNFEEKIPNVITLQTTVEVKLRTGSTLFQSVNRKC